jgi:hypothetical protein
MTSEAEPRARIVPTSQEGAILAWEEGLRGNPGIGQVANPLAGRAASPVAGQAVNLPLNPCQAVNPLAGQAVNLPLNPGRVLNPPWDRTGAGRCDHRLVLRLGYLRPRHVRLHQAPLAVAAIRRLPVSAALQAVLNRPAAHRVQRPLAAEAAVVVVDVVAAVGAAEAVDVAANHWLT